MAIDTYRELCLNVPQEYESLRATAHRFAKEVLRPAAIELDRMADPKDVIAPDSPLRRVLKQAYGLGYHVAGIPVAMGGLGLDPLATHILHEELAWGSVDLALSIGCAGFPAFVAASSGNADLYQTFVKPYVEDREAAFIGCWAITEPNHGSDHVMVGTREYHNPKVKGEVVASAEGDSYVIKGQKSSWVSNGTIATHAALYLRIESGSSNGETGMSRGGVAVVPLNLPGVSKGKPLNKLGQRALNQGEIFFDNVRIPRHYMVVNSDTYEQHTIATLTGANGGMSTAFTGLARAAYEAALEYSKERIQGGRPICEHQLVQKHLFEMFTKVEACRALSRAVTVYNSSSAAPSLQHAIAAKTFCTQAAFEVTSDAVQIFGGNGLSKEYPVEKMFRDARASLIEDGTNDVLSLAGAQRILAEADGRAQA
ncbi:MAG TPA: acyl-CoA dehydrogenase family protein [Candidatus Acidoferrales bacterium]|nr:acyl-CoA dehydrogenase family protein [Candidatus Acidoferrales bacterium]